MTPIPMVSATPVKAVPIQGMQANAGDGERDFFEALLAFFGAVQTAPPTAAPATGEEAPADEGQSEVGGDREDEDGAKGDRLANPLLGSAMGTPAIAAATDTPPPIPAPDGETGEPEKDGGAAPTDPSLSPATVPAATRTDRPLPTASAVPPATLVQRPSAAADLRVRAEGAAITPAISTADRRVDLVRTAEPQAPTFAAVTSSPGASPRRDTESAGYPPREVAQSADDGLSRDTPTPVVPPPTNDDPTASAPAVTSTAPHPAAVPMSDHAAKPPSARVSSATAAPPPAVDLSTRDTAEQPATGSRDTARPAGIVSTPTDRAAIAHATAREAPPAAAGAVLATEGERLQAGVTRTSTADGDEVEPGQAKRPPSPALGAAREAKGQGSPPDGAPPASGTEGRTANDARTPLADVAPSQERDRSLVESGDKPGGETSRALPSPTAAAGNPSHSAPLHPSLAPTAPREIAPPVIVTTPVAADRLPEVLAGEMVRTTPSGEHRLEITLHPPELGRVEVSMVVSREAIHAQLVAHTEGARDLLNHHLPGLRQQLVAQGFADPQLSVDLRHGSGERHWQRPNDGAPAASRPEAGQPSAPATAPAQRRGDRQFFHRVA
jgi:hypothetical protein